MASLETKEEFGRNPLQEPGLFQVLFIEAAVRHPSRMDILKMLAAMRQERAQIEEAILVLERLASGQGRRRGRPPAWMTAAAGGAKKRGRPPGGKNKSVPQE